MSAISTAAKLACISIYDPIDPGVFGKIYRVGETVCGTAMIDGVFYIVCQGTESLDGWLADLDIMPTYHPVLGNLHTGFWQNIPDLAMEILKDIPPGAKIVVTGHSKGAAEAILLSAELKISGIPVDQAILYACPNAGYQRFADWVTENLPCCVSYRNAPKICPALGDPVPCVPPLPNTPPVPHTDIDSPPAPPANLIDIAWHRAALYFKGCNTL